MKKIIFSTFVSLMCLLLLSFLLSLLFSFLQYSKGIQIKSFLTTIFSVIIFFISGCIFGLLNKKQGLIGSIPFILVYLLFIIIFNFILKINVVNQQYFLLTILKMISYISGSILFVNLKTK